MAESRPKSKHSEERMFYLFNKPTNNIILEIQCKQIICILQTTVQAKEFRKFNYMYIEYELMDFCCNFQINCNLWTFRVFRKWSEYSLYTKYYIKNKLRFEYILECMAYLWIFNYFNMIWFCIPTLICNKPKEMHWLEKHFR